VAVGPTGSIFVSDSNSRQVLKLPAGSSRQSALPFSGLRSPQGVAVDREGSVYVADAMGARVVKLRKA
jgi:serine/threonine-protein kinase